MQISCVTAKLNTCLHKNVMFSSVVLFKTQKQLQTLYQNATTENGSESGIKHEHVLCLLVNVFKIIIAKLLHHGF